MSVQNNFDLLITEACRDYCIRSVNAFLSLDTAGFEITSAERRQFYKILKASEKARRPKMSVGKIIAAACIIVLSVGITACVAIPKVREAIKRAVIERRDKYVAVEFVEEASETEAAEQSADTAPESTSDETELPSSDTAAAPKSTPIAKPTKIEQKAYASYLPQGYTYRVDIDTLFLYVTSYYCDNEIQFSLSQKIITEQLVWADSEEQDISHAYVNGFEAVILCDSSEPNYQIIIWQDMQYEYYLEGYFQTREEMLQIAQAIELQQ